MYELKRLDEVCDLEMGQSPDSSSYNEEGRGIPFFQGNADFGDLYPDTRVWCDEPTKIVEPNTLLISVRAPIGALNFAKERSCIGRGLAGIVAKPGINLKYIYYYLKYKHDELNNKGTGSTFKAIAKSALGDTMIKVLPLDEQSQCTSVLDKISVIINAYKAILCELDNLIKSRFVELFGDPVINPFRWNKQALGTLCDIRDGTHDSPEYFETGYPLVTSKNVTGGQIDLATCNFISEIAYAQINERSKVDYGDIIMPMIGTVGKPVIVDIEPRFAIKNVALIKFPPRTPVQNIYIRALLESDYFDREILSKIRGGTQKFIALGDIRKLEVLVPDIATQQRFVVFVEQVDKLKVITQKSLDATQLLFDSLMQEYFG